MAGSSHTSIKISRIKLENIKKNEGRSLHLLCNRARSLSETHCFLVLYNLITKPLINKPRKRELRKICQKFPLHGNTASSLWLCFCSFLYILNVFGQSFIKSCSVFFAIKIHGRFLYFFSDIKTQ